MKYELLELEDLLLGKAASEAKANHDEHKDVGHQLRVYNYLFTLSLATVGFQVRVVVERYQTAALVFLHICT